MAEKPLSLEAQTKLAAEHFKLNPTEKVCFTTSDGNVFAESAKNAAELHSKTSRLELNEITNKDFESSEESTVKLGGESGTKEYVPTAKSTKEVIAAWLVKNEVEVLETDTKAILLEKLAKVLEPAG